MVAALGNVKQIDPAACRRWVAEHCDVNVVAAAYEAAYHTVFRAGSAQGREPADRAFGGFDGVRVGRPGAWRYG
jgi:hypothetical protein